MKRSPIFIIIFFISTSFCAKFNGDYPWEDWTTEDYRKANTAIHTPGLTQPEKDVFFYTNLARMKPRLFAMTYGKYFVDSVGKPNNFTKSLLAHLKVMKPVGPMDPDTTMCRLAARYAYDCAKYGWMDLGHFKDREQAVKDKFPVFTEAYEYGASDGYIVTMGLLIDAYNDWLLCRQAMLDPRWTHLGVGIRKYNEQGPVGILEFGQIAPKRDSTAH